jgi:hypothetical protein
MSYSNRLTTIFMLPNMPFNLYDPNLIDNLSHLPEMCIFGLINEHNKIVLIYRTTNIVTALSRIVNEYKYSNKNILKFGLIIIETITDKHNLWVRYNYWNNEYSNNGYTVGNKCKYNMNYKLRKQALKDFRVKRHGPLLFYVKVVSRRYKEVIVGIFDKVEDMDAFVNKHYANGINNIIYSNNNLTRQYLETIRKTSYGS